MSPSGMCQFEHFIHTAPRKKRRLNWSVPLTDNNKIRSEYNVLLWNKATNDNAIVIGWTDKCLPLSVIFVKSGYSILF